MDDSRLLFWKKTVLQLKGLQKKKNRIYNYENCIQSVLSPVEALIRMKHLEGLKTGN